MKISIIGAFIALSLMSGTFSVHATGLLISDVWVRAAPPNAPALAAFMKLENQSTSEITIVGASTTLPVNRVELHRTIMADGMMKMVLQKNIPVAAGSSTLLEPGSWHIMLIKPDSVPVMGETVQLTLQLGDGSSQTVTARVKKGKMKKQGMMKCGAGMKH
ncbi:copper chaperone PCu(A)C [Cardiobacterium sp. AH-315-I02]|nr:copper chaperone PCu(A)C [Cardiobacterium sp. AH-315-I02]